MNICPHCIAVAVSSLFSHGCALVPATTELCSLGARIARAVATALTSKSGT